MKNSILYPELNKKILLLMELCKNRDELSKLIDKEFTSFDEFFVNSNVYEGLLKTTLLKVNGKNVEFQKLKEPETFETSLFLYAKDSPKLYVGQHGSYGSSSNFGIEEENGQYPEKKEYCLLIDKEGDINLLIISNINDIAVYNSFNSLDILYVNLPLMLIGILNQKEGTKAKTILENLIEKDSFCTISNIVNYIKNNKKEMAGFPLQLEKTNKIIVSASQKKDKNKNSQEYNKIYQYFSVGKYSSMVTYKISMKKEKPIIELDIANRQTSNNYILKELVDIYPAMIVQKGKNLVPYYFKNNYYPEIIVKIIRSESPNEIEIIEKDLITLDEKIKEIKFISEREIKEKIETTKEDEKKYFSSVSGDLGEIKAKEMYEELRKNILREEKDMALNKEQKLIVKVKEIMTAFDLHFERTFSPKIIPNMEKILKNQKRTNELCKKNLIKISKILTNIYQKEILLENL